tara:strand:+ start:66 stop:677 length:612 start_codon:yes stop_codon:yes gene_type:complete
MQLNRTASLVSVHLLSFFVMGTPAFAAPKTSASSPPENAPESVQRIDYYVGDFQDSSVDGKQLYGPRRIALLKRVVSSKDGTITEYFIEALSRYTRTIKVASGSTPSEYTVDPPMEAGQVLFKGTPWTSQSWTYTVDLFRVGSKNVTAEINKKTLTLVHKIFGPKGKATGLRTVSLSATKPEAYMVKLRAWESKYGAPQIFRR